MGRRSTRSIRLVLATAAIAVFAGIAATVAHALAFDDATPCQDTQPVFSCPSGLVGSSYSIQLQGRGGCGPALPYQYRVLNGALPPGLSLSSGGNISGTPQASGTYQFWLELSDQNPPTQSWCRPEQAQREFRIIVQPGLRITTNSLPQVASVGVAYSATLDAQIVTNLNPLTGVAASGLTWTVASGALPPGLTLGSGVITGTPTTEGSYTFQVKAAIDASRTSIQTYSLTVRQPLAVTAAKPLATAPLPTVWEVGVPFSGKLTASGGNGTYTIALAGGTLPGGLAVGADGTISGTPTTAGAAQATIRVTDGEGRTLDYVSSFAIANKVSVSTLALRPGKVGKRYRAKLNSTGGLPPRIWKVTSGKFPKGLRMDRKTGVVSGIPRKSGSFKLTFQVTDGLKVTATKTLRIVVAPAKKKTK